MKPICRDLREPDMREHVGDRCNFYGRGLVVSGAEQYASAALAQDTAKLYE